MAINSPPAPVTACLRAGFYYFLGIFTLGFVLGIIRNVILIPLLGDLPAVLVEIPVILAASWFYAGWLIRKKNIPGDGVSRILMGGFAFACLMAAEIGLSMHVFSKTWRVFLNTLLTPHGLTGFSAQIVFGLMPLIRLRKK